MSLKDSDKITCTECGQPIKVTYWSSINVTFDPDLEEQLLDGSLNKAICPKCGNEHNVIYHTLYHDMERYFMIEYSGEDEESSSHDHSADQELEETLLQYRFLRRVYSWNQMREKVIIFRDGLNDIIIELMKTMLMLYEFDMKEPEDDVLWYTGAQEEDGGKVLIFEQWKEGEYTSDLGIPVELYDHYAAEYGDPADLYRIGTFSVVNQGTMLGIINELRGAR